MITVERLNRTYGPLRAVKDVSFSISQGEVIGLLGPNGAGKTTIMKMMCGFLEPSSGTITINGSDIRNDTKLAQANIGYLPENLPVYPEMTVVAYLEYAAELKGIDESLHAREIRRVIAATELHEKALSRIGDLSRGLKQRVGVAQALLGSPKVLILDEPTNGLDPTQTQHMRALIRELASSATVILSTHILSEVEAVCDRVLMVRRGELVLDSRLEDVQQSNSVAIQCNLSAAQVEQICQSIGGVAECEVKEVNAVSQVQIALANDVDGRSVCSQLAKHIIQANGELYQLHREERDLEALFREVNLEGGVAHAA